MAYSKMERQYTYLKEKKYSEIDDHYNNKLIRRFKRWEKQYDLKTKLLVQKAEVVANKKPVDKIENRIHKSKAKPETLSIIKKEAFSIFQLYIRISKSDKKGFVKLVDTGKQVYYTECDAGHYYPKSSYPQLAFYEDNVRPISKFTNKAQGDNIGTRWHMWITVILWVNKYKILESIAIDKSTKSKTRKKDYYREQIEKYAPKAIKEFQNRKLEIPRMLHKYLSITK